MDDSRPYTIPYSGSRSRRGSEGFAPASQPPPPRNMGGHGSTPYQGATVAQNAPPPPNSGAGPSTSSNYEPACKAYLGPSKYRCQSVPEKPANDNDVHFSPNYRKELEAKAVEVEGQNKQCADVDTALKSKGQPEKRDEAEKAPEAKDQAEEIEGAQQTAKVTSTMTRSFDGSCDEPTSTGTQTIDSSNGIGNRTSRSMTASEEIRLEELSECRPCRLFIITHGGQPPKFCDRCKILDLFCTLCKNHSKGPAESSSTHAGRDTSTEEGSLCFEGARSDVRLISNTVQDRAKPERKDLQEVKQEVDDINRDIQDARREIENLQARLREQAQRGDGQVAGIAYMLTQTTIYTERVMHYTASLEGRIMSLRNQAREQNTTIMEMRNQLRQLHQGQQESSADMTMIREDVTDLTHRTSGIRKNVDRFSRQLRSLQGRVSAISHRILSARKRKTERVQDSRGQAALEADD